MNTDDKMSLCDTDKQYPIWVPVSKAYTGNIWNGYTITHVPGITIPKSQINSIHEEENVNE